MTKCFDIMPHSTGWIYVLDGTPSASYPSYQMALRAAREHAKRDIETLRKPIFRRLEVSGKLTHVGPHSAQQPAH